jgi:5-methyltetrahydropteroyltriglutamate--homocysteine methyltransferase
MVNTAVIGFPRIGVKRELKKASESYWKGNISATELQDTARKLRLRHWQLMAEQGIANIPCGDFSLYDLMLDTCAMVGAIPPRYNWQLTSGEVDLDTYFAMARGSQTDKINAVAMEMTKWFDTNYHYIVPELAKDQQFKLSDTKVIDHFKEAKQAGINAVRPMIIGIATFLKLAKGEFNKVATAKALTVIYKQVLLQLKEAGATAIQIDEPIFALDLDEHDKQVLQQVYTDLADAGLDITITNYFGAYGDGENLKLALSLPITGIHADLVRGDADIEALLAQTPQGKKLSLGLVEGRNIWANDLTKSIEIANKFVEKFGSDNITIATSCSLLHSPVDLDEETKLDSQVKSWLAFAKQKVAEVATIAKAVNGEDVADDIAKSDAVVANRAASELIHNQAVKGRVAAIVAQDKDRASPYQTRADIQEKTFNLPLLPTTTIGSFPQTKEIRRARADNKKGVLSDADYNNFLKQKTDECIKYQEEADIDALVHGEFERNDMVEYFGEQLSGFAFTKNGWVQSYGSRCVKPPIIFGDVARPKPMTVEWSTYAQSKTDRVMKGMLTGPVTILQWSFVRDDQPRKTTCEQIALAILDEVLDLEKAGITMIQIDEPALREGLPLRQAEQHDYLTWAIDCFRISAAKVADSTQIHTHMCYSEFNEIMQHIADMDADVISIETSRSNMELLEVFTDFEYPNEIGPGVYDIHSPRIPEQDWMVKLLEKALEKLPPRRVWVNPDCGLKTRNWTEVKPALENMVNAAKIVREKVS